MSEYVLGFDCGGTKTGVRLASLAEVPVTEEEFSVGGMNVNSFGREEVLEHLVSAYEQIGAERLSKVRAICYGAAGISNPLTREVFLEGTRRSYVLMGLDPRKAPLPLLIGDHQAALYGAHGGKDGMILIAGTGSICCGHAREGGEDGPMLEARCGGYGHLIDDGGSGYALGRDVLSLMVRAEDGRIPPTAMRRPVFEQLGIDSVQELIRFVYDPSTGKKDIAALAPALETGLAAGAKAALEVLEKEAGELAELVVPVARSLKLEEGYLTFCGSVLLKSSRMAEAVRKQLSERLPGVKTVPARYDAAFGACLAALRQLKRNY